MTIFWDSSLLKNSWFREGSDRLFNLVGEWLSPRWDKRLLGLSRRKIRTIIDVGANRGQFAKQMRRQFPNAKILAFEPLPEAYRILEQWGRRYPGHVSTFNLALGDKATNLDINSHLLFSASSSLLPTTDLCEDLFPMVKAQEKVQIVQSTLDQAIEQWGQSLTSEVLVKLDVQGYEDRVIRGGKNTLNKASACIIEISLDGLYQGQCQFRDLFYSLDKLGFSYAGNLDQVMAADGHIRYFNALFLRSFS